MAPPPRPRSGPDTLVGVLPLPPDAVYEILLRLPAKGLCRLRAVCRPWRSLLSDPHFIAAHAARHPGPFIVIGYHTGRYHIDHRNEGIICDMVDLSGRVVKRVRATGSEWVMSVQLNLVCIANGNQIRENYRLLNPVTGAVYALPEGLAKQHEALGRDIFGYQKFLAFGQVASTGEYKVLRVLDNLSDDDAFPLH